MGPLKIRGGEVRELATCTSLSLEMRYRALHTVAPGVPQHASNVNKSLAQAIEITARRLLCALHGLVSRGTWRWCRSFRARTGGRAAVTAAGAAGAAGGWGLPSGRWVRLGRGYPRRRVCWR